MPESVERKDRFLVIFSRRVGFFALFFQVLGQIKRAENFDMTPVVYFGSHNLFWDEAGFAGSRNVWEYCFEPVSPVKIEDVLKLPMSQIEKARTSDFKGSERSILYSDDVHEGLKDSIELPEGVVLTNCWPEFDPGQDEIHESRRPEFHRLIEQYVKVKPHVTEKLNEFVAANFSNQTVLGVHFRGKEREGEISGWYGRRYQGCEKYLRLAREYLKEHPEAKVFLASDSKNAVEAFSKEFGSRLFTTTATKAENVGIHYQIGGSQLAVEALLDCLLLSKCDFLIHGISNVAYAALCLNSALPHRCAYDRRGSLKQRICDFFKSNNARGK